MSPLHDYIDHTTNVNAGRKEKRKENKNDERKHKDQMGWWARQFLSVETNAHAK